MDGQWGVPGYTEVRELGTGAGGRVVLARRDHDGTEVAIKYLSDRLRIDVSFVARFRHEARLLGTLRTPHNAQLIDYVESSEGAAIVMELVNGVSLREILRSEGPTGPEAALAVLKGSLQGLAAAHSIGVVHRDFKPENVMVQDDGASKLVDFGIAVRAGEGASAAGTPPYMAPEQWSGGSAAPATDVYAATVVFFECLTGARPFRASNVAALARQHHSTPPPVQEVPEPLQGLVERGLAKHPADRPSSAETFLAELEEVAGRAYGADWEERGRHRLARLAGLLLLLFPSAPEAPVEVQTSLAETTFADPPGLLSRLPMKILIGTVSLGVVIGVAVVLVNAIDVDPVLQAQTSQVTPSTAAPGTEPPATEEPSDEPTEPSEDDPTPTPTPDKTTLQPTPRTTQPATAVTSSPKPVTKSPTPKPSRTRTVRPTPTPVRTTVKATPTESPDPELTGRSGVDNTGTTPPRQPSSQPTTASPTVRPTRPDTPPPSSEPPGGGETPTNTGRVPGEPTPAPEIEQPGSTPAALLALGLVTSGTVPVTLAVKRRMAGRHRRRR
ncbi:protein kinase [Nonomuraea sp. NPDC005983]|uniref:serine/threonine-protein kinase n=1 Tax=Nonomuraea sp. NPDC005983 TaxID=3155595 RepID=UPI0033B06144